MVRILGGPLRLNERAANDIFSGWTSPSRYEPPADVEKNFKIFLNWKNHAVAIKVTETPWHCFTVAVFQGKFAFLICERGWQVHYKKPQARLADTLASLRRGWQVHFKKLFVHGGNFLHERDGQRFWCWVASWRKRVVQHSDGVL